MTSRDFCYWLQGWFELNKTIDHREGASKETLAVIENHLAMVFKHEIDPSMGDAKHQAELSAAHGGGGTAVDPKTQAAVDKLKEYMGGAIFKC